MKSNRKMDLPFTINIVHDSARGSLETFVWRGLVGEVSIWVDGVIFIYATGLNPSLHFVPFSIDKARGISYWQHYHVFSMFLNQIQGICQNQGPKGLVAVKGPD